MTQFIHRWLGALLTVLVLVIGVYAYVMRVLLVPVAVLFTLTVTQFGLGVLTLLFRVPVSLGSLHQAVACLLVISLVYVLYLMRARPEVAGQ